VSGHRVENFRVALRPGVVDRDAFETPFLAVAHQLAIVAVHQERVLRAAARTLPRHEMLRHEIRIERGRIATDLDLEIASGVTGVERTEQRKKPVHDGLATDEFGEIELELSARGFEIEHAIFRESGGERIGIAVIETEGIAMQCVRNLIAVGGQLREIVAHARKLTADYADATEGTEVDS
jgi:hypothetical protein